MLEAPAALGRETECSGSGLGVHCRPPQGLSESVRAEASRGSSCPVLLSPEAPAAALGQVPGVGGALGKQAWTLLRKQKFLQIFEAEQRERQIPAAGWARRWSGAGAPPRVDPRGGGPGAWDIAGHPPPPWVQDGPATGPHVGGAGACPSRHTSGEETDARERPGAQEVRLRHGDLLPAWAGPPCAVLVRQPAMVPGARATCPVGGGPEWPQGSTAPNTGLELAGPLRSQMSSPASAHTCPGRARTLGPVCSGHSWGDGRGVLGALGAEPRPQGRLRPHLGTTAPGPEWEAPGHRESHPSISFVNREARLREKRQL